MRILQVAQWQGIGNAGNTGFSAGFDPWVRKIPCRRRCQPAPVFLPGESHGQRSLVGSSPWGLAALDWAPSSYRGTQCTYVSTPLPVIPTLSCPTPVHKSVLCLQLCACPQIGSSLPFSRFHIYALMYNVSFFFWLTSLYVTDSRFILINKNDPISFPLWLTNTPLCVCTTSLSIHLDKKILMA